MKLKILQSKEDASVNFVEEVDKGIIESRFVQRTPEYFAIYLSAQTACNRGCQFCHLTTTSQTTGRDVTLDEFERQAIRTLEHYWYHDSVKTHDARYVHFNFMARGEPLSSKALLHKGDELLTQLGELAVDQGRASLASKFNISTIMPLNMKDKKLIDLFRYTRPVFYYSLYSVNDAFRKKWMPGALPYRHALDKLVEWQEFTGAPVKIHFPLIAGENDSDKDIMDLRRTLNTSHLECTINIVRYNPPDEQSKESADVTAIASYLNDQFPTQVVSRVGLDVFASCGTFVAKED